MNDQNYYCIKARFKNSNLSMSVNVLRDENVDSVCKAALRYFIERSTMLVDKLLVYDSESDMHSGKKCLDIYFVQPQNTCTMTADQKNNAVEEIYKTAEANLKQLLANIRPAEHCSGALSTMIETVKQDLVYLKDIALEKPTDL